MTTEQENELILAAYEKAGITPEEYPYVAMDANQDWYAYKSESEPEILLSGWISLDKPVKIIIDMTSANWRESLREWKPPSEQNGGIPNVKRDHWHYNEDEKLATIKTPLFSIVISEGCNNYKGVWFMTSPYFLTKEDLPAYPTLEAAKEAAITKARKILNKCLELL